MASHMHAGSSAHKHQLKCIRAYHNRATQYDAMLEFQMSLVTLGCTKRGCAQSDEWR